MANLLEETLDILKKFYKTPTDVLWCGSNDFGWFYWEDFAKLADHEYDDGYGSVEVALDLVIVGYNWWLERDEYDGAESWKFKTMMDMPKNYNKPKALSLQQVSDADNYSAHKLTNLNREG